MKVYSKLFDELSLNELYEILLAREEIFTHEKGMKCKDIDREDKRALHIILEEDGELIGYLRAIPIGAEAVKIGRVLTKTHGRGHGKILMAGAINEIYHKYEAKTVTVHSRYDAVAYYEKMGFRVSSDEYVENGVVHVTMDKQLFK